MWSINNLLIEQILLKTEVEIIGCQHGGVYNEKIYYYCDYEIYCPSLTKFIGFNLFKYKINPSLILNFKDSFESGIITYITGPNLNNNSLNKNQKKILSFIKNLSKKYDCAIRVHPLDNVEKYSNFFEDYLESKTALNNINIFQAQNKNTGISNKAKICIFDYPHSTLFWDAFNKGLKIILIYNIEKNNQLSEKYLKLYDLVIDREKK